MWGHNDGIAEFKYLRYILHRSEFYGVFAIFVSFITVLQFSTFLSFKRMSIPSLFLNIARIMPAYEAATRNLDSIVYFLEDKTIIIRRYWSCDKKAQTLLWKTCLGVFFACVGWPAFRWCARAFLFAVKFSFPCFFIYIVMSYQISVPL